ncbi:MAG: HAD hydrolase family protein [Chitinophagaceae bacterium]
MLELFKNIRHFIFDIDGVLTDGSLIIHPDGTLLRTMNIKDGYALQLAVKKGYSVSIISGAKGQAIQQRLTGLGVSEIYLGIEKKINVLNQLVENKKLSLDQTLYMGDDMPDLVVMKEVYLACCPSDAITEIQEIANYISPYAGGKGCVRDVIEKVLKLNQDWE